MQEYRVCIKTMQKAAGSKDEATVSKVATEFVAKDAKAIAEFSADLEALLKKHGLKTRNK